MLVAGGPRPSSIGLARSVWLQAIGVFLIAACVYWVSPVRDPGDSRYSLLLSESLLRGNGFTLDRYLVLPLDPAVYPNIDYDGLPYQIVRVQGHLYNLYPPGNSLLSAPLVALLNRLGISALRGETRYDFRAERFMEGLLASLVTGASVAVWYLLARLFVSARLGVLLALALALGSAAYSTASRVLWSHTWEVLLLSVAVYLLARLELGRGAAHPIILATLLAWAYFSRPLSIIPLACVGLYLVLCHRPLAWRYAAAAALWLGLFVAFSLWLYGSVLPPYYREGNFEPGVLPNALAANLVSPARGLLLFTPSLLFVAYALIRYRSTAPARSLAVLASAVIGFHLVAVSCYGIWWAGSSYGPRFTTDLLPWFALLGSVALASVARAHAVRPNRPAQRLEVGAGLLLVAASILMHAPGALSTAAQRWNADVDVDEHPEMVWDWSRPQFLAGVTRAPRAGR